MAEWDALLFCGDSVSSPGKDCFILGQKGHPAGAALALSLRKAVWICSWVSALKRRAAWIHIKLAATFIDG